MRTRMQPSSPNWSNIRRVDALEALLRLML
jgi:hypothetical protein